MNRLIRLLSNNKLDLTLRLFVIVNMYRYAHAKIVGTQFPYSDISMSKKVNELSGFDLAWIFFGHSYAYTYCIAVLQIIGALLLVFNRTKLIGALLLFPVLFNIIMVDVFYKIPHGALAVAITLLLCLIILIFNSRNVLINLILDSKELFQKPLVIRREIINIGIIALLYEGLWILQMFINLVLNNTLQR